MGGSGVPRWELGSEDEAVEAEVTIQALGLYLKFKDWVAC